MKHKYADILIAIAEGKKIEMKWDAENSWEDVRCGSVLEYIGLEGAGVQFRVKPVPIEDLSWKSVCRLAMIKNGDRTIPRSCPTCGIIKNGCTEGYSDGTN